MPEAIKKEEFVELVKDVKDVESLIVAKFTELEETTKAIREETEAFGLAQTSTVEKHEELSKHYNDLYDRMLKLEQRTETAAANEGDHSIGKQFADGDAFAEMSKGSQSRARMEFKTSIINATGASQPLVQADRMGGIATTPNRILTIRDVLPVEGTDSNLCEFTRESGFTNNAGPQISGSPQVFEGVTKPESGITFSLVSAPVITLAHFIPASKQVLDDADGLIGHINNRLLYGLKLKEETQLLAGTGSNHQLNGLITQATTYVPGDSPNATNEITIVRDAMRQAQISEYMPDFLVLHPTDWYTIETRTVGSGDDRYVVGNPNMMMTQQLWGLPVVVSNSITAGTFLLGSSAGAVIKDRQSASIELSREDSTNFRDNMVTVLAEERLALCVYRTEAFITGSL